MDVGTWIIPVPTQFQTYASTHLAITTGRGDKSHIQSALCKRNQARKERAQDDLLKLSDADLLATLELIKRGKLTRGAILLAGTEAAIHEYVPGHNWTFLQMTSDTDYGVREDRVSALPLSLQRVEELLVPFNPITTYKQGLFHYEYRTWPEIAVREALMNAFCHADLRIAGPVMVKLYPARLEISNNGGFIAGIKPDNILHHQPAARNPLLVEVLTRLRLVNRSNLGISRMFSALLIEGKEPPHIREVGESVVVSFPKGDLNAPFRMFAAEESERGRNLNVDELLLFRHLLEHRDIDIDVAANLCRRDESETLEKLLAMESATYIERIGDRSGVCWRLSPDLCQRFTASDPDEPDHRIDWEISKARVLSILKDHALWGEPGLNNREIRQITRLDRNQVFRLMTELRKENPDLKPPGRGKHARYEFKK